MRCRSRFYRAEVDAGRLGDRLVGSTADWAPPFAVAEMSILRRWLWTVLAAVAEGIYMTAVLLRQCCRCRKAMTTPETRASDHPGIRYQLWKTADGTSPSRAPALASLTAAAIAAILLYGGSLPSVDLGLFHGAAW